MTHHFIIEIIKYKTVFKVTYRNGKFRKIEHLRGKLDQILMDALGKAIPVKQSEIEYFKKIWLNNVNYQIEIKKGKTLYTKFLENWFHFYEDKTNLKPKHTGADGNALKQIISYLTAQSTNEDEALAAWKLLLDSWNSLSEFHQKQIDIKYINSKLNVILGEIKQQTTTNVSGINRSIEL